MKFFLITGPPAVGKMTVGKALADRLDYKLFHNHISIEVALKMFWYGSSGFKKINSGIRNLVFDTVSKDKTLKGFIFTLVWAFDLKDDWDFVETLKTKFTKEGWEFYIVELFSPIETRLERNDTPFRLSEKKSKSNIEKSNEHMIKWEQEYRMNSNKKELVDDHCLKIDNANKSPEEVVDIIVERFKLI